MAFGGGDNVLSTNTLMPATGRPAIEYVEKAGMKHDWPQISFPESDPVSRSKRRTTIDGKACFARHSVTNLVL